MRQKYEEDVKPLIEEGNYELAAIAMHNINLIPLIQKSTLEIIANTHFGDNMLISAQLLGEALYKGNQNEIRSKKKFFEMYAAQTSVQGGSLDI